MYEAPSNLTWTPISETASAYARISHDRSAIHLSRIAARQVGLPSVILHGMYVYGRVISHLDRFCQPRGYRLLRVECRFLDVTLPGLEVTLEFTRAEDGVRFTGSQESRPIISGAAHIRGALVDT